MGSTVRQKAHVRRKACTKVRDCGKIAPRGQGRPADNMNNPPSGAWLSQIESARSAAELVRLLRDYLASLTPEERAQLPHGCVAENISGPAEIQEWAVALAQGDLKASPEQSADTLRLAAIIFAAAGSRLPRVSGE